MQLPILRLSALGIAVVGLSAADLTTWPHVLDRLPVFQEHGEHETPMDVAKLPAAVQATAKKVFGKLDGLKASQESVNGAPVFEVEGKGADGMDVSFTCPDNGQVYELERGVSVASLPGDAGSKIQQMFPGSTVLSACSVEMHYFEVKLQKDGKTQQVTVGVSGRVYSNEEGEEEGEGEEEEGG
jgi:uncharacterized membrane protein YkoI